MSNANAAPTVDHARFGRFVLIPSTRRLERDGLPVTLGGRAIDILSILVDRAGEVVSHNEMLERVWPTVQVDPSGLRVQMAALRKALADGEKGSQYIVNIAGRGYCFVAPVVWAAREQHRSVQDGRAALPKPITLIGRDEIVRIVVTRLVEDRFVTITGPGGVGKTSVAIAVAHSLLPAFDGEVYFIDLGDVKSSHAAHVLIGRTVLRIYVMSVGAPQSIADGLKSRRVLIVLDCCDHIAKAMGDLAALIINTGRNCHVLATSRESLLEDNKATTFLTPLDYPPDGLEAPAQKLGSYPSVRLLNDLVSNSSDAFSSNDESLRELASIARQLDGLPLALKIAAASIAQVGIESTRSMISSHLGLFLSNPDATPRHQSLTATLEWSYSQLTPDQRSIFRNLSVFAGSFTMDGIQSVAAGPDTQADIALASAMALLAKSMLYRDSGAELCVYRMLDTTRSFASSKLLTSGIGEVVKRRHAQYFAKHLTLANAAARGLTTFRPTDGLISNISNIRAALEWCFSEHGDAVVGAELAAASAHMFGNLSMHVEGISWINKALSALNPKLIGTKLELDLRVGILSNAMYEPSHIHLVPLQFPAIIHLADEWGSAVLRVEARAWDCMLMAQIRHVRETINCALRAREIAMSHGDYPSKLLADWILGFAYHISGDLAKVGPLCSSATALALHGENIFYSAGQTHAQLCATGSLARTLWLQGRPEAALSIARAALAQKPGMSDIKASSTFFLPLLIWAGAWDDAEQLIVHYERAVNPDEGGAPFLLACRGQLELRYGRLDSAISLLDQALNNYPGNVAPGPALVDLAEALALSGQTARASQVLDLAFASDEHIGETFSRPELFRVMGVITTAASATESLAADTWFKRAAACAEKQGSLSLELRAATGLARYYREVGRGDEAHMLLENVYERFTEGFDTPDLVAAEALLKELNHVNSQ